MRKAILEQGWPFDWASGQLFLRRRDHDRLGNGRRATLAVEDAGGLANGHFDRHTLGRRAFGDADLLDEVLFLIRMAAVVLIAAAVALGAEERRALREA